MMRVSYKSLKIPIPVIPAKAGIQSCLHQNTLMDSGLHRSDDFISKLSISFHYLSYLIHLYLCLHFPVPQVSLSQLFS
jgi:hypothetical protein